MVNLNRKEFKRYKDPAKRARYLNEYVKKYNKINRKLYPEKYKAIDKKYRKTWEQIKEGYYKRNAIRVNFVREYKKKNKCLYCGWNEHPEVLLFHHRNPDEKEFSFNKGRLGNIKMERIKKEIEKCDLICPNCHNWLHYKKTAKEV